MRVLGRAAVLVGLGAVAATPRARAQSVVVGPLPSSLSAVPGASITVPVVADLTSSGGASLGSTALRLTWRAGTLSYVSTGTGALGAPTVNADSASAGILKVAVASPGGATGMAVLFNATFSVTGAPADTTILGLTVGEITAAGTFADLKAITSATRASFCTSTGTWGDLNNDGSILANDAAAILLSAVGLSVPAGFSVANGDVDGSGTLDTRDALIVLSDAVGIPVTQFRVGRLNAGLCSLRSAASVQIQPRTATVAIGDSLPVTVVVKDSVGALVQGVGVVWQTKDSAIVRPGTAGSLVGVAPGSTYALVFAQPGVKDSVPVTVTSTRHVWYVNPVVAAANLGVELGSQLYPFSSIDTALTRAAAGDTVRVGVADYGPVRITKPLTVLGDSTAAGFPRLASTTAAPTLPALRVDTVPGLVTIRGLRLLNSQQGLAANQVQTLVLGSISVEGARDVGLRVYGGDSVQLSHVSVVGAVGKGLELDGVRVVALDHVTGDAVTSAASATVPPASLRVAQVTTLSGDSLSLGSAGAVVDSGGAVTLHRIRVATSRGPALMVHATQVSVVAGDFSGAVAFGGGTPTSYDSSSYTVAMRVTSGLIQFDSTRVHNNRLFAVAFYGGSTVSMRADTVAGNYSGSTDDASSAIYDFGWLRLAQTAFVNNGPGYADIEGLTTDSVTADTTVFDGTDAHVYDVAAFRMHGGAIRNASAPTLDVEHVGAVEIDSVQASGVDILAFGFYPAVYVYEADTVSVNGMNAHDNASGVLGVLNGSALRVTGGSMLNNSYGQYSQGARFTVGAYSVSDTRVYGLTLRDSTDVGIQIAPSGASRAVIDSSFLEGSVTLVQESGASGDTLIVSRSSLTGFGGTSGTGVDAQSLAKLAVTGSFLDSLSSYAIYAYAVDTDLISQDVIRAWGYSAFQGTYGVLTVDSSTFTGCAPFGAAISSYNPGTTSIVGNTLNGCGSLVYLFGPYQTSGSDVQILGNALTRDTTTSLPGINLGNGFGYVQIARNAIVGGGAEGIDLGGGYSYGADTARVDSNTVQQTLNNAIRVGPQVTRGVSLRYNVVADARGYGMLLASPFVATFNTAVRAQIAGVGDSTSGAASFRLGNIVGNLPYGAMTWLGSLQADNNWWGRSQGPKCVELCDQTATASGDSIAGSIGFTPVVSTGAVVGAPAIPAPPPAPIARAVAARLAAVPRSPKPMAGAQPLGTTPQAPPRAAARPPLAAPAGSARPARHRKPVWMTGVPR